MHRLLGVLLCPAARYQEEVQRRRRPARTSAIPTGPALFVHTNAIAEGQPLEYQSSKPPKALAVDRERARRAHNTPPPTQKSYPKTEPPDSSFQLSITRKP
jgi:hypothetical protein